MEEHDVPVFPGSRTAFLLVQLGAYAARRFEERLKPLDIVPRHFGLLRAIAASEGESQQAISARLGIQKPQMVWLIDELEHRGFVQRKKNRSDRRANALYLTPDGRDVLVKAAATARDHGDDLLGSLSLEERNQLARLLARVADSQGITESTLPGRPQAREDEPA